MTEYRHNIDGKMVELIPKGEGWCDECSKHLPRLKEINDKRIRDNSFKS